MKLDAILKVLKEDKFRGHEVDWTIAVVIREVQKGEPEAMKFVASLIHEDMTKIKEG